MAVAQPAPTAKITSAGKNTAVITPKIAATIIAWLRLKKLIGARLTSPFPPPKTVIKAKNKVKASKPNKILVKATTIPPSDIPSQLKFPTERIEVQTLLDMLLKSARTTGNAAKALNIHHFLFIKERIILGFIRFMGEENRIIKPIEIKP